MPASLISAMRLKFVCARSTGFRGSFDPGLIGSIAIPQTPRALSFRRISRFQFVTGLVVEHVMSEPMGQRVES